MINVLIDLAQLKIGGPKYHSTKIRRRKLNLKLKLKNEEKKKKCVGLKIENGIESEILKSLIFITFCCYGRGKKRMRK